MTCREYRVTYSHRGGQRCELVFSPSVFPDPFTEAFRAYKRAWVKAARGEAICKDYDHPRFESRPVPEAWQKVDLP